MTKNMEGIERSPVNAFFHWSGRFMVFMAIASLTACRQQPPDNDVVCAPTGDRFFPLCSYISEIIADYSGQGYLVNKEVTLNDKNETLTNLTVNWKTEMQAFAAAYINRSAWQDKFTIDTMRTDSGFKVRYTSDAAKIPVKEMEVDFSGEPAGATVVSIHIKTARKNVLYTSEQVIDFVPGAYYTVKGKQRTMILSKMDYSVRADIIMPEAAHPVRNELDNNSEGEDATTER